ncbi:hypothetical protein Tco_0005112, partial [Tanacetum coccineum]
TYTDYFSIKFPYAGRLTDSPNKHYVDSEFACVDMVNNAEFRIDLLNSVLCSLGFEDDDVINLYYKIPLKSLDTGLRPLVSENDTSSFLGYVHKHKMMYVYVQVLPLGVCSPLFGALRSQDIVVLQNKRLSEMIDISYALTIDVHDDSYQGQRVNDENSKVYLVFCLVVTVEEEDG